VCGPRECSAGEWDTAYAVGALLAGRGAVVVCGGYGGVMAAAAQGARSGGGVTVGILSGADRAGAEPALSVVIPTGLGEARNAVIVNAADAVIVVGGSWGTLSELALALRRGGIPVVQVGGWRVVDAHGDPVPGVVHAETAQDAVDRALTSARDG